MMALGGNGLETGTLEVDTSGNSQVRIELAATPGSFRLARIMVTAVAGGAGFTLDALEDLRLAVDELCFALVGAGRDGLLTLTLRLGQSNLEIEGDGAFRDVRSGPATLSDLSRIILETVVDDFEVCLETEAEGFRMVKRRP